MRSKWVLYAKASGDTVLAVAVALAAVADLRFSRIAWPRKAGRLIRTFSIFFGLCDVFDAALNGASELRLGPSETVLRSWVERPLSLSQPGVRRRYCSVVIWPWPPLISDERKILGTAITAYQELKGFSALLWLQVGPVRVNQILGKNVCSPKCSTFLRIGQVIGANVVK